MKHAVLKPSIQSILRHTAAAFSFEHNENVLKHDMPHFERWLEENGNGQMEFLEKNREVRKNVELILPGAKSALIFLFPYASGKRVRKKKETTPAATPQLPPRAALNFLAKYARGKDYHRALKKELEHVAQNLTKQLGVTFSYRAVVDSIPFLERAHAREAGLGFVGKNTMLIRPGMGSFFFVATLLTTLPIEALTDSNAKPNPIFELSCQSCRKCLDACPTQALSKPYYLDANKCIAYLTIEYRGLVDKEYMPHFAHSAYGCDICQDVCPYNLVTDDVLMLKDIAQPHLPFLTLNMEDMALMTFEQYQEWFGGTATTRAKYQGLVRNALYHLYATKNENLTTILEEQTHRSLGLPTRDVVLKTVQQIQDFLVQDASETNVPSI